MKQNFDIIYINVDHIKHIKDNKLLNDLELAKNSKMSKLFPKQTNFKVVDIDVFKKSNLNCFLVNMNQNQLKSSLKLSTLKALLILFINTNFLINLCNS